MAFHIVNRRLLLFFSALLLPQLVLSSQERQVYVVYLGEHSGEKTHDEIHEAHHSYLFSVKGSEEEARSSMLYSYKHSINGFAAVLTDEQAQRLAELDEVVSVFRSYPRKYSLQTTRSWEFSGLYKDLRMPPIYSKQSRNKETGNILSKANYGKDVIVGLLDSGWWPEHEMFDDEGMGPIPKSWKGNCQTGQAYNSSHCNRKLIGARYYLKGYEQFYGFPVNMTTDYRSARDKDGHGTHTSTTVAGRPVPNASSLGGFARGTATGGAPLARLAMYKVCWPIPNQSKAEGNTCFDEDMLAAMDDAIRDGVHVLSISIVSTVTRPYAVDGIAIGAFHAVKKDIVVVCSGGNSGPAPSTVCNHPPWMITVAASSLDRKFEAPVSLGHGQTIEGETTTPYKLEKKMYPLVYAAQVSNPDIPHNESGICINGSLSPEKTKGKIVLCMKGGNLRVEKGLEVIRAGGVGMILGNTPLNGGHQIEVDPHFLPATAVNADDALSILHYINSTNNPTAYISPAKTTLHTRPAPFMADFSSRGPSGITPQILKPDITAPGVGILAGWTPENSPTKLELDHRAANYNIISGTSMSCPHIAATAALLRSIHPTWSSAAIRSSIMTTAVLKNNVGKPIEDDRGIPGDPFHFGSGHFRPSKAVDPGLVYDASYDDYLLFFCSIGLGSFSPKVFGCPKNLPPTHDLNYPSLAIPGLNGTVLVKRSVTNVGGSKSVYFARVRPPVGFSVKIYPPILHFERPRQKKSFTVTVAAASGDGGKSIDRWTYYFGWYTWNDGYHNVRSPIAVSLA